MKKRIFITIVLMAAMATVSFAQGRGRNCNRQANRFHSFDVTAPMQLKGEILDVQKCDLGKGRNANGIKLTVADGNTKSVIQMGPVTFMEANKWQLKKGETVAIKAFKGTGNSAGSLFAAEISRSGKQLVLRDKDGLPMWRNQLNKRGQRGQGRRGRGNGYGRNVNCMYRTNAQ